MRQKQIIQASNTLPSGLREESVDSTRDTTRVVTHPVLRSRPNIALRPVVLPSRRPQTQHPKLKRQASNPLPFHINKESVESTRDIQHPVLLTKSLPTSETSEIYQPTRPPKTPRSATEKEEQFVFPEDTRVSRKPTNKTRARRNSSAGRRNEEDRQKPETHSAPSQLRKSPNSINPSTQQRPRSRDRMGSSVKAAPAVWAVPPQSPRRSPRFQCVRSPQKSGRQNAKRSLAVDRVLVVKAKDGRPLNLPAIPVERLINKGFYLVPDVGRMCPSPSRPSSKSVSQPPVCRRQMKRIVRQTRSMDAINSVSSRQEETPTSTGAGNRKDPHEKNSLGRGRVQGHVFICRYQKMIAGKSRHNIIQL